MVANEGHLKLEVVLPLRDMQDHVEDCLRPLLEQTRPGDVVTVVDDGSHDETPDRAARLGARVIRLPQSLGPYACRHLVAQESQADGLLFVDGRSRALAGLLDSHRRQLSTSGVAMSCTEVVIVAGSTFASRIAAQQRIFSLEKYIDIPGRPDYFPTCNLGVLRSAYLAVGGFRRMRSGGDADLCWRIQSAGLGRLSADPAVRMQWVPRASVRQLARQWFRYGQSSATLKIMYPNDPQDAVNHSSRLGRARRLFAQARKDFPATLMLIGLEVVMQRGAATARRYPPDPDGFAPLGMQSINTERTRDVE